MSEDRPYLGLTASANGLGGTRTWYEVRVPSSHDGGEVEDQGLHRQQGGELETHLGEQPA
jgi:hypothetical protein